MKQQNGNLNSIHWKRYWISSIQFKESLWIGLVEVDEGETIPPSVQSTRARGKEEDNVIFFLCCSTSIPSTITIVVYMYIVYSGDSEPNPNWITRDWKKYRKDTNHSHSVFSTLFIKFVCQMEFIVSIFSFSCFFFLEGTLFR